MTNQFTGKTALISGGAGGIGYALAEEFGELGMNIVIADIEAETLKSAAAQLSDKGINVLALPLDVTNPKQWEEVVQASVDKFGGLNMLVNNAGVGGIPGTVEETTLSTWQWVVDVNLMGVVYGTHAAVPAIKKAGQGGWIINVASMAGMGGVPYSGAYSATKAAVVSMSESWAAELKHSHIRVSALCPAFVKTRIHESLRTQQDKYKAEPLKNDPARLKKGAGVAKELVESGIPASLLAKRVVEAIEHKQLYIFTHPNYRDAVAGRGKAFDMAFEDAQNSDLVKHLIDDEIVSL